MLSGLCYAQSITWQRTYNHYPYNQSDYAFCIGQTTDGNFIVSGHDGVYNIWVIKINPYGDTIWTCTPAGGEAYALIATNDGGCILTGVNDSLTAFTIKISGSGNLLWNKSYGGSDVRLYSIIKTDDGGFLACGRDWRTNIDGLIIKIDSLGNLLWMKYYPAGFDKTLTSIINSPGGNFLVTGNDALTYGGGDPAKTLLLKLNPIGDTIWSKRLSVNNTSCVGINIVLNNNFLIITGFTGDTAVPWQNELTFIMKLDTNGNLIFAKDYTANNNEYYMSSSVINNTIIFTTSKGYGYNHISGKVYFADMEGQIYRQKEINDTGQVQLHAIYPISNNDILFAGYYGFYGPTRNDYYVIRTDSLLNPPPIGVNNYSNRLPGSFTLYQNYPNPFNPKTTITFDLPKDIDIRLTVYDVLGREVYSINEFRKSGSNMITFDGSNLASGVYYYSLETGTFAETRKMVLIK